MHAATYVFPSIHMLLRACQTLTLSLTPRFTELACQGLSFFDVFKEFRAHTSMGFEETEKFKSELGI